MSVLGDVRIWTDRLRMAHVDVLVDPDAADPHVVTMTVHKWRDGQHCEASFCQQFSTASGALSMR